MKIGWKGPYTHRHAFHEPFVLFGFLAAATRADGCALGISVNTINLGLESPVDHMETLRRLKGGAGV